MPQPHAKIVSSQILRPSRLGRDKTGRLPSSHLDSRVMQRHLATQGFATLLIDIARAAILMRAPSLKQDVTLAAARSQWPPKPSRVDADRARRRRLRKEPCSRSVSPWLFRACQAFILRIFSAVHWTACTDDRARCAGDPSRTHSRRAPSFGAASFRRPE